MDRYNHDLSVEDTDDTEDTPVFGSFSSYTPQYRKQHYSWIRVPSTNLPTITTTTATTTANTLAITTVTPATTTIATVGLNTKTTTDVPVKSEEISTASTISAKNTTPTTTLGSVECTPPNANITSVGVEQAVADRASIVPTHITTTMPSLSEVTQERKGRHPILCLPCVNTNSDVVTSNEGSKMLSTPELRKLDQLSASCLKVPSTPDADYLPEFLHNMSIGCDGDLRMFNNFLRHNTSLSPGVGMPRPTLESLPSTNRHSLPSTTLPPVVVAAAASRSTPESSQTDSDDFSPQMMQRKRKGVCARDILPRFSISVEDETLSGGSSSTENTREQSPLALPHYQQHSMDGGGGSGSGSGVKQHRSRSIVKSASALGLSLMSADCTLAQQLSGLTANIDGIQSHGGNGGVGGGGGSSTASSRDTSPCRELSPLVTNLKPPIIIRRGPRGFGFTVHTIRVFYGDTDFYTMHHLVMAVDEGSPAFEAGLRPADLITHVNGETVQGLFHTQVLQLLLSGGEHVTLRATPLEHTSIQSGGRKRDLMQSKLAKKGVNRQKKQSKKEHDKKRKTSLFRRISSKRASAEIQQVHI